MKSAREIWETALGELELQVSKPNFRTWFEKTVGLSWQGEDFIIGVPNTFVSEYLERNQRSLIEKTLINLIKSDIRVGFQVSEAGSDRAAFLSASNKPDPYSTKVAPRLNPGYTFDSFVVGSCNRMAHAASLDIARVPGQNYNPLFIYGGVGLGKTHLLQAIGHQARASNHKVIYTSSEQFTNDFITAVRDKQMEAFQKKYRSVDLLLIDDIHFIAGKISTEECFFHVFNDLHNAHRQIVLTSNCPPKAMGQISDRLRSRFGWGLAVEIKPPSLKTRLDILSAKTEKTGVKIPPKVLECIAQSVKGSVRELEGGLNRVTAYARLTRLEISPEVARQALTDVADQIPSPDKQFQSSSVIKAVAEGFNLDPADITGRKRDKETALARQVAAYLLKQQNNCSLAEIGLQLGGRSPSTVSHATEKVAKDIENSPYLERKIKDIAQNLARLN